MIKGMLKTGLFLFIVSAVSGLLLAYSESITGPIISKNQLKTETEAQNNILPSKTFSEFTANENGNSISFKVGFDESNNVTGAVFKVSPKGFGGPINTLVGINKEGKVTGFKILSLSETPGLGSKLTSETFTENLKTLLSLNSNPRFKVKKDGGDVDAITAATISSRAFCLGLSEAQETFNNYKEKILAFKAPENQIPGGVK